MGFLCTIAWIIFYEIEERKERKREHEEIAVIGIIIILTWPLAIVFAVLLLLVHMIRGLVNGQTGSEE
jgi:NADH:ubiquinone oxidoreductase subunit 6 (subunit J)